MAVAVSHEPNLQFGLLLSGSSSSVSWSWSLPVRSSLSSTTMGYYAEPQLLAEGADATTGAGDCVTELFGRGMVGVGGFRLPRS